MARRGRPKKVEEAKAVETEKQVEIEVKPEEKPQKEPEKRPNQDMKANGIDLSGREYVSLDEAGRFLGITCAKLWFEHGHLKGTDDRGFRQVSVASILRVRRSKLMMGPNL